MIVSLYCLTKKHLVCLRFLLSNVLLGYLRAFAGIIDEYFAGYYTEDMIESQVMIKFLSFFLFKKGHILYPVS